MSRLPLSRLRALDLTDEPTVLAARLLADLGADVIRAESLGGDRVRRRGPFLDNQPGPERSLAHLQYNAGKRSLALALDRPAAWELLDQLADSVDLVLAPLEKSRLARRFFDQGRFRTVHPGSVGVVDVVFREHSSHSEVTDLVGVAAGGLLFLNGFPEDAPNLPAGKLAYKQTSLAVALAAIGLVLAARRTRQAGWVTINMQEAVALTTLQSANENFWHWHGSRPARNGFRGLGKPGSRSVFECQDGLWVSVSIHPPYWDQFAAWTAEVTCCADLLEPEWSDPTYRLEHPGRIAELTQRVADNMTRTDMVREGQKRLVLIGPVNNVADIASDEQLLERGIFRQVPHPQFERELTLVKPPFVSSAYIPPALRAPVLGEHSRAVLQDAASLDSSGIDALVDSGVVLAHG